MTEDKAKSPQIHRTIYSTWYYQNHPEPQRPGCCDKGFRTWIMDPNYVTWCCLGWMFPLPTTYCIGLKMKEKRTWLKYGIPGKLITIFREVMSPILKPYNLGCPRAI